MVVVLPFPAMKDFPVFAGVTPAELERITSAAQPKNFSDGEIIFKEGSPIREVIMLLSGSVNLSTMIFNANEVNELALGTIGAGAFVGLVSLCRAQIPQFDHHHFTAVAVEACSALSWDTVGFEKLLISIPTFRRNVFEAMKQHLHEMQQRGVRLRKQRSKLRNDHIRRRADKVIALYATLSLLALCIWEILRHAYK